ncbi:DUF1360 domain-containing protein [Halobacillus amylolyticus]|uniref:DUF1360 domain-containing protein n=1 Tax=Halobacillus amylolyticus TaxID=2932259 RepID=A0ABY4HDX9_9BACI|nr:DUF1360 domain-containing protein [Halobacillus amylolyticus]UOR13106.1 DUF1360 domain-containing protein [Halobacillus amylolyticus]
MDIGWFDLLMLIFASFRFTRLIVDDLILEWIRQPFLKVVTTMDNNGHKEEWLEPKGMIGELISCQWCVGVWSALLMTAVYLFVPYGQVALLILAIAGLQSIIYEWSER